ncbi:GTP cyclohydrolase II-domain-containing protein [Melampsora americana]|nr:GTP cyclohydrolase II-domain-containing protein [Melampsora americana]
MEVLTSTSANQHQHQHHQIKSNLSTSSDLDFLAILTSQYSTTNSNSNFNNSNHRRPQLDPLILETASLSGPHQTRNHYLHEYFPHSHLSSIGSKPNSNKTTPNHSNLKDNLTHVSQQAPRSSKQISASKSTTLISTSTNHNLNTNGSQETTTPCKPKPVSIESSSPTTIKQETLSSIETPIPLIPKEIKETIEHKSQSRLEIQEILKTQLEKIKINSTQQSSNPQTNLKVKVNCKARTRIPTSKGPIWLHVYENTIDQKEHLAIVMNPLILSKSLNEIKSLEETDLDRLIRGALPMKEYQEIQEESQERESKPIVRIHSECFTGETIGSNRCDCGFQLNQSMKYILNSTDSNGLIIYLRQEGRGIGLESKLKAYNLQDLGFDTIESNLLLGFHEDLRTYQIGISILKDFNLNQIKLMTNNPNKILSLQEGNLEDGNQIQVIERIPIVLDQKDEIGDEVKGYLRTKILKMGHMIDLPHF